MKSSFRWKSNSDTDIDAYFCNEGGWYLFVIQKNAALTDAQNKAAIDFEKESLGNVLAVGGALKTKQESKPLPTLWFASPSAELWAIENGLFFRLETENVLNPGLFLDQSQNRKELSALMQESLRNAPANENLRFLNLFSYSGAFSVRAAASGALETVSIDVSKRYLSWEKKNHEKNNAFYKSTCAHKYFSDDARAFLERAQKKGTKFRAIVLDPPTFSKSAGKVFEVQKHFFPMLQACLNVLAADGVLLASLNDHRMPDSTFLESVTEIAKKHGLRIKPGRTADGFSKDHGLKSAWIF